MKSIVKGMCPRCKAGKIFLYPPYNYIKFHEMNDNCPKCGQTFHPEPGFYFGAMYISYAFSVAWVFAVCIVLLVIDQFTLVKASVIISVGVLLLLPLMFQYSRILYLYGFGGIKRRA